MKRIEIISEDGLTQVYIDGVKQEKVLYIDFEQHAGDTPMVNIRYEMESKS